MDEEEPLAYQIGDQPFLGLTIHLDSHPLIPRPETEWWTDKLLTHVGRSTSDIKFLDLCAGSGAIGCAALKMLPEAQVYFGEIDPAHEATILKNIRENHLDKSRAHIHIGDLFDALPADATFDVIAVNPPYIPADRDLPASVADYEPALALRAGSDGLAIIRRVAVSARRRLAENGVLWCECDSAHADAACTFFADQGLHADILNDQYCEPRVIRATMI